MSPIFSLSRCIAAGLLLVASSLAGPAQFAPSTGNFGQGSLVDSLQKSSFADRPADSGHAIWGKRPLEEQYAEPYDLLGWSPDSDLEPDWNPIEDKRTAKWQALGGAWGKRAAQSKWNKFQGAWGKREPSWNSMKGLWGKRDKWNKISSAWGKRAGYNEDYDTDV